MNNDSELVSILIPVYNRKGIVNMAIESALRQTYSNCEIIVVDNKSTDGTYEEIRNKYKKEKNVHIYQNEMNLGPVLNWKKCLEYAKGKYIKFLWSDDFIESDFVEKCVDIFKENSDIGFVYSNIDWTLFGKYRECQGYKLVAKKIVNFAIGNWIYRYSSVCVGKTGKYSRDVYLDGLFNKFYDVPVSASCALFKKEDVKISDEIPNVFLKKLYETGAGIDSLMFLNTFLKYEKFYYIDEVLSCFGVHDKSFTVSRSLEIEYWVAKKKWLDEYKKNIQEAKKYDEGIINEVLILKGEEASGIIQGLYSANKKVNIFRFFVWKNRYFIYKKKQAIASFWKIRSDDKYIRYIH